MVWQLMVRSAHKLDTLAYLCLKQIRRSSLIAQTPVATDALALIRDGGHGVNGVLDTTDPDLQSTLGSRTLLPSVHGRSDLSSDIEN
jgi:hypothetical protein